MTERLEKEAEEYAEEHAFRVPYDGSNKFYDDVDFKASKEGYLAGAEPREKQIQALGERCNQLLKDKGALLDQIEKMKNQWNCKNNNGYCVSSICPCKDKWEIKEK